MHTTWMSCNASRGALPLAHLSIMAVGLRPELTLGPKYVSYVIDNFCRFVFVQPYEGCFGWFYFSIAMMKFSAII